MRVDNRWRALGSSSPLWDLVRYYRSLRGKVAGEQWLDEIGRWRRVRVSDGSEFAIEPEHASVVGLYVQASLEDLRTCLSNLRTEEQALRHCRSRGLEVGVTRTQSSDHHQSAKAMIAAVSEIASSVSRRLRVSIVEDPQKRAVWCSERGLHATARNPDGAIPSLLNPCVIWEIKEYWGKTGGGSKMSDAVYECHLVGRELRDFESRTGPVAKHVVFLDGRDQWAARKSDMLRFIDLFHQGLIDHLIIGREVETEWEVLLTSLLRDRST